MYVRIAGIGALLCYLHYLHYSDDAMERWTSCMLYFRIACILQSRISMCKAY